MTPPEFRAVTPSPPASPNRDRGRGITPSPPPSPPPAGPSPPRSAGGGPAGPSEPPCPPAASMAKRSWLELREQLRTSLPAVLGMALYKLPWLISLAFVGRIGPAELAAAALASALCDVTGMSLSVGLSSAMTTLAGQARGDLLARGARASAEAEWKRGILERVREEERAASGDGDEEGGGGGDDDGSGSDDDKENRGPRSGSDANTAKGGLAERSALLPPEPTKAAALGGYGSVAVVIDCDDGGDKDDDDDDDDGRETGVRWGSPHNHNRGPRLDPLDDPVPPPAVSSRANGPGPPLLAYRLTRGTSVMTTDSELDEDESPLLPMVYLYRGIFVQMCLVVPVGIWWLRGVYPLLIRLGQPDGLSYMTQNYLRILTPGLWSYSINWTLTAWLQAIEMADVPPYAALVGGLLHVPFNLFFIHVCGWGWLGVGAATVMFQVVQPTLMFVYLFATGRGYDRLLEQVGARGVGRDGLAFGAELYAAVSSPAGILQYLELAVPGLLVVSEWWASEVAIFLSGRLRPDPEIALSAMAIYQSVNSSCFMLPVGVSVGGSTRVGNLLGGGDARGAGLASGVCVWASAALSCTMGCILFFTPHTYFPSLFSPDADVIDETAGTMTLLSVYVFADGIQVALNGIIKGCGRQCITVPIVLVAYWVVGVPLAYYLAFGRHDGVMCRDAYFCGIVGLVGGMTVGTWVHLILLWLTVGCTTDWDLEVRRAQGRLALEQEQRRRRKVNEYGGDSDAEDDIRDGIRVLHRGTLNRRKDDDESIASITTM